MPPSNKRLFINFSDSEADMAIALKLIRQINSTGLFQPGNIQDHKSRMAGDNAEESLKEMVASDGIVHLLSSDFFQPGIECYRVWDYSLTNAERKLFPVRIRSFFWESRDDLQKLHPRLLPADDAAVEAFSANNTAKQDGIIRETVKEIVEQVVGTEYAVDNRKPKSLHTYLGMSIGILGLAAALLTYFMLKDFTLIAVILLFTILILTYLRFNVRSTARLAY
jgi:hypothetical protein